LGEFQRVQSVELQTPPNMNVSVNGDCDLHASIKSVKLSVLPRRAKRKVAQHQRGFSFATSTQQLTNPPSHRRRRYPRPVLCPSTTRTRCLRNLPLGPRKHTPLFPLNNNISRLRIPQHPRFQHRRRRNRLRLRARRRLLHSLHSGLARPHVLLRWNCRLRTCHLHDRRPVA
jgi:hypothetical protein